MRLFSSGCCFSDGARVFQVVLPEALRPLVPLEALQRKEVERPAAEGGLLLLRPGPGEAQARAHLVQVISAGVHSLTAAVLLLALHWNTALHHPALPAAHHGSLLPGLHPGKTPAVTLHSLLKGW